MWSVQTGVAAANAGIDAKLSNNSARQQLVCRRRWNIVVFIDSDPCQSKALDYAIETDVCRSIAANKMRLAVSRPKRCADKR